MNDKVQEIRKALEGTQWGTEEQRLPHRCEIAQNGAEWLSYLLTEIDEEREARKELENHYAGLEYANVDNVLELEQLRPEIESLQQQLDAAKQKLGQAIEALEWYADKEKYIEVNISWPVMDDFGERARKTLSLIREEAGGSHDT
jgi:chromosome segregation ATPase